MLNKILTFAAGFCLGLGITQLFLFNNIILGLILIGISAGVWFGGVIGGV